MLLIVRRPGHAGHNSKNGAEPVVHAINRIRHPTAAAAVPAFAFKNRVEQGARTELRHHRLQSAGVRFFFERTLAQKIFHIVFVGQGSIALIAKFRFMFFFGCFHSANRNLGAKRAI